MISSRVLFYLISTLYRKGDASNFYSACSGMLVYFHLANLITSRVHNELNLHFSEHFCILTRACARFGNVSNVLKLPSANSPINNKMIDSLGLNFLGSGLVRLALLPIDTTCNLIGFISPSEVGSLYVAIVFRTGALASEKKILHSAGHVVVMPPACADHWISPCRSDIWILWPLADVDIWKYNPSNLPVLLATIIDGQKHATVNSLVILSDHPTCTKKWSNTRSGRLRENSTK